VSFSSHSTYGVANNVDDDESQLSDVSSY